MVVIEGLSPELNALLNFKIDNVKARRRVREAFKEIQLKLDHVLFKMPCDGVKAEESYVVNARGLEIFTKTWLPATGSPKAVVCYCHGYGDTCTFFFEGVARKLASCNYGVFSMDCPGFGLSEGLHGYITSFDKLVDDVVEQFSKVKENPNFRDLPRFLLGQSMGGAVALKVHLKQPDSWNGAILVAPMCKIADDVVPPWAVKQFLMGIAKVMPKSKLVPQKDLAHMAFRDPQKEHLTKYNVISYKDRPRLGTAQELLKTAQQIEKQLEKISLPLLILHGKADIVTDPSVSKALYEKAKSPDKKLNLYDDAYHSLLEGEPDDVILRVLNDIITWLDEHTATSNPAASTATSNPPAPATDNSNPAAPTEDSNPVALTENSNAAASAGTSNPPAAPTENSNPAASTGTSNPPAAPTENSNPAASTENSNPAASTGTSNPPAASAENSNPAASTENSNPAASTGTSNPSAAATDNSNPAAPTENSTPAAPTENSTPAASTENSTPAASTENSTPAASTANSNPAAPTENSTPAASTANSNPAASTDHAEQK